MPDTLNWIRVHKLTIYFLDIDILVKQLLPPNWRVIKEMMGMTVIEKNSGAFNYLKTVLMPFKLLLKTLTPLEKKPKAR